MRIVARSRMSARRGLRRDRRHAAHASRGSVAAASEPARRDPDAACRYMTEAWYCCAEPGPEQLDLVMKRVLLLATTTGYQIRSFGEAAEKLGVRLVFASDRCDQLDDPWSDQRDSGPVPDEAALGRRGDRRLRRRASRRRHRRRRSAGGAGRARRRGARAAGQSTRGRARQPQQAREPARLHGGGSARRRRFSTSSLADDPRRSRRACVVSRGHQAARAVGSRGVMRVDDASDFVCGVRAPARAAAVARHPAASATRRTAARSSSRSFRATSLRSKAC